MLFFKVLHHPLNEVVFEHSLNDLVEEVWGDQFVDVCMGKVFGKWLGDDEMRNCRANGLMTYDHAIDDPIIFPYCLGVERGLACMCMLLGLQYRIGSVEVTGW